MKFCQSSIGVERGMIVHVHVHVTVCARAQSARAVSAGGAAKIRAGSMASFQGLGRCRRGVQRETTWPCRDFSLHFRSASLKNPASASACLLSRAPNLACGGARATYLTLDT